MPPSAPPSSLTCTCRANEISGRKSDEFSRDVPLDEDQESLVPEDWQGPRIPLEADEVEDERVDDLVGQGILLVEKDADEDAVRTCARENVRMGAQTHMTTCYTPV